MTDDRQTDHAVEKCVETDEIVCVVRAILRNNYSFIHVIYSEQKPKFVTFILTHSLLRVTGCGS